MRARAVKWSGNVCRADTIGEQYIYSTDKEAQQGRRIKMLFCHLIASY